MSEYLDRENGGMVVVAIAIGVVFLTAIAGVVALCAALWSWLR